MKHNAVATGAAQGIEDDFATTEGFKSYVSKPEITALDPSFLVPGSQNVLIDYANRVISRNGYTLYNQANTGAGGIKSAYDWETSLGAQISLRAYDHTLEFDWNGSYNTLLSNLKSVDISFAKVLDYNEQQDVLLFVLGEGSFRRWGGGTSIVASSTGTTVKKAGVMTSATTIAFVAGDGVSVNPTLTDSGNGFLTAQFAAGDTLTVTGSTGNSSIYIIASVTAGTITLIMSNVLVNEIAGPSITLYNQTGPTWKAAHFLSSISPRSITYKGTSYAYTGGENTDTLTGLTSFPTVTSGDAVWQTPDTVTLPSSITTPFPAFYPNLIGVQLNMVFLGSTASPMIFGSQNINYTNFTLTSPRAPGDPVQQPLTSGPATCIIPYDNDRAILNIQNTLLFGSGIDAWDQIDFHSSADNTNELLRIIRYKTAQGAGLISKAAVCPVKNGTVYISREPTLDSLGNVEAPDGKKSVPLSDLVKNDFDTYDFTNCHVKYWKRSIYISLPVHGLVLVYDMMRNLWQPPQTMPISRFAIINDWLYGHSSITNETYKLFVGTNDNGLPISQRARFAYNNGGDRSRLKNMSSYWSDGYITPNGELMMNTYFNFGGSAGVQNMSILGNDSSIVVGNDADPLGSAPLGSNPLGGATSGDPIGLPYSGTTLLRFWQDDTFVLNDYIEQFTEYVMETLDGQFAIVAHGSNQHDASTVPISHKK